jgi:hypothetical protein
VNQQARSNSILLADVDCTNPNHSPSGRVAPSPGLHPEPEAPSAGAVPGGAVLGGAVEVVSGSVVVGAVTLVDVLTAGRRVVVLTGDGSGVSATPLQETNRAPPSNTAATRPLMVIRIGRSTG